MKKILVVGLGYVGLAQAILLAQRFSETCLDNDLTRVQKINDRKSYFEVLNGVGRSNLKLYFSRF